jgi:hypothetical protein
VRAVTDERSETERKSLFCGCRGLREGVNFQTGCRGCLSTYSRDVVFTLYAKKIGNVNFRSCWKKMTNETSI